MRIIGYCRVSTAQQANEGVSLDVQRDAIWAYANYVGAELVDVVVEQGSGKDLSRPKLTETIARLLNGEANALCVYAIDRLSRSTLDFLTTVDRLNKSGIDFVSCREQLDSSTPHGRFTMTMFGALAQMEREIISARTKDSLDRLRAEGKASGPTPFGWQKDAETGMLYEDPGEQDTIELISFYVRQDRSWNWIADRLNRKGIPPKKGKRWQGHVVKAIFERAREVKCLD